MLGIWSKLFFKSHPPQKHVNIFTNKPSKATPGKERPLVSPSCAALTQDSNLSTSAHTRFSTCWELSAILVLRSPAESLVVRSCPRRTTSAFGVATSSAPAYNDAARQQRQQQLQTQMKQEKKYDTRQPKPNKKTGSPSPPHNLPCPSCRCRGTTCRILSSQGKLMSGKPARDICA